MGAVDLPIASLVMLVMLLAPIALFSLLLKLNIAGDIIYSSFRMVLQLSFVGIYLQYLFRFNNPLINIVYLFIMIAVAALSIIKSAKLAFRRLIIPTLFAVLIPQALILFLFMLLTVGLKELVNARYLVPIGGMILGNCLSGNIISLSSFYNSLESDERFYLYTLSLGASQLEAVSPYLRSSMHASIAPFLASMATIGLVSLPGMMTGQLLGGSIPLIAIKYQIAIMIAIFVAKFLSSYFVILFSLSFTFNGYSILKRDVLNKKI